MTTKSEGISIKLLRGVAAGVVAGAVASFAMDRFQAAVTSLSSSDDDAEPATEKAARSVSRAVAGRDIPVEDRPLAGQSIHYSLGIGLGVAYAIAAEFRPDVTGGYGTGFGVATATLLDEATVPAVGLGDAPWRADPSTTLYSYASHLVFGGVAELIRRQVAKTLTSRTSKG